MIPSRGAEIAIWIFCEEEGWLRTADLGISRIQLVHWSRWDPLKRIYRMRRKPGTKPWAVELMARRGEGSCRRDKEGIQRRKARREG